MGDIKFRAWDKSEKAMAQVIGLIGESGIFPKYANIVFYEGKPAKKNITIGHLELMQYTGLKDKAGKEIYEGDIIIGIGNELESRKDRHVISFRDGSFGCALVNGLGYEYKYAWFPTYIVFKHKGHQIIKEVEVIGNIYENPELLEDPK